jgi:hypothetical protein
MFKIKQVVQTQEESEKTYILPKLIWYPSVIRNEIVPLCQGRVFDRTESIDLGFKQKILSPIPEFKYTSKTFSEECGIRAIEIAQMAKDQGKKILVTCSGGMDSTSVIAAFMMYTDAEIELTYSQSAIDEWPEFHAYCLKHPRITRYISFVNMPFLLEALALEDDHIIITGDPGDLIFGSKLYREDQTVWLPDGTTGDWQMDHWAKPWEGVPAHHRDLLQPIVDKCPVDIENNYDLTWWLGFCMKFQLTETRLYMAARKYVNIVNFFTSDNIQNWSMSNSYAVKCPNNDWDNLKYEAKKHLHLWFPDETVWAQVKRDSLKSVWTGAMHKMLYDWVITLSAEKKLAITNSHIERGLFVGVRFDEECQKTIDGYDHETQMITIPQELTIRGEGGIEVEGMKDAESLFFIRGQMFPVSYITSDYEFENWPRHKIMHRVWQHVKLNGGY